MSRLQHSVCPLEPLTFHATKERGVLRRLELPTFQWEKERLFSVFPRPQLRRMEPLTFQPLGPWERQA